ncbi:hypothetical protein V8E36_000697 [Tilletia maclaganii]
MTILIPPSQQQHGGSGVDADIKKRSDPGTPCPTSAIAAAALTYSPLFLGDDEDEQSKPVPNIDEVVASHHISAIGEMLVEMDLDTFVERVKRSSEYIGDVAMKDRLDAAKLDERGRFMVTLEDGSKEELRWCYAGKGRSAFGFINGKTGNTFPPIWASAATRPSTVVIENSTTHEGMRRKRVTEDDHEYTCNVFTHAQAWPIWSIGISLPCVSPAAERELRSVVEAVGNRVKSLLASEIRGPADGKGAAHRWVPTSLGGPAIFPRAERAVFFRAGEVASMDLLLSYHHNPHLHHDLLLTLGKDLNLRYNAVPDVTALDVGNQSFYKIDWHHAHRLPASALWEVGFYLRVYRSQLRKKIGRTCVLESLVAHGKAVRSDLISTPPAKRKVDYFSQDAHRPGKRPVRTR